MMRGFALENPEARRLLESDGRARLVHFLRHGEALHEQRAAPEKAKGNVCRCDEPVDVANPNRCPYLDQSLVDAPLTERGHEQAHGVGANTGALVVLTSPAMRTLQTAVGAFDAAPIVALEELRSRVSAHMHTKRRAVAEVRGRFLRVDFSAMTHDADALWDGAKESRAAVDARALASLEIVMARPERNIAVVTHFTMLLAFFQRASESLVLGVSARTDDAPLVDTSACPIASTWSALVLPGEVRSLVLLPT